VALHDPRPSCTICIPARNEAATIAPIVRDLCALRDSGAVLDDVLVVDDCSTDGTGSIAARAGARVVRTVDVLGRAGWSRGKGDAISASLVACETDLIGWVDGDLIDFPASFVDPLFDALILDDHVQLVKGAFTRVNPDGSATVGGRVTALTARPLLRLMFPALAAIGDPLSGVFAGRVDTLRGLRLEPDYGVDVGVLIDVWERYGSGSIREVHLGKLVHERQSLERLTDMATMVARAIIGRAHSPAARTA